ncbi:MAG: hypothetical protein LBD55_02885 [Treponema sp.]|jgi:hypothetical protein|nr:hypothetical protein [Treponema sp.]
MRETLSLNQLHQHYISKTLPKKDFEELIFKYILDHYRQFHLPNWSKEKCTDYLCSLYPRISRAIDTYKNIGSTFEAYILSKVYWYARERWSKEADHHVTEYACWTARAEDMAFEEHEPEYAESHPAGKPVSNPRQVLILLLKSYFYISEDFISRAAPYIGIEKERLSRMIDELRDLRLKRDEEIRELRERLHCQYYRCLAFESKLEKAAEGSALHERMKDRVERARKRYASMRKRYRSLRMDATNREIAQVLGVAKGTVDSNLYALKQKIKTVEAGK